MVEEPCLVAGRWLADKSRATDSSYTAVIR